MVTARPGTGSPARAIRTLACDCMTVAALGSAKAITWPANDEPGRPAARSSVSARSARSHRPSPRAASATGTDNNWSSLRATSNRVRATWVTPIPLMSMISAGSMTARCGLRFDVGARPAEPGQVRWTRLRSAPDGMTNPCNTAAEKWLTTAPPVPPDRPGARSVTSRAWRASRLRRRQAGPST